MKLSALAMYANAAYSYAGAYHFRRLSDCVVISVRGTRDPMDFVKDLQFIKHRFLGFGAHSGFVEEFCDLWMPIHEQISISDKVYITGHSLGGAIATLLAMALKAHFQINSNVVTFGSPRVLDEAGAEEYNRLVPNTIRVVHKLDLVPRIPKLGYQHVSQELHLDDSGRKLLNHDHWLMYLLKILRSDLDGMSLENHHMRGYLRAVDRYERRYRLNN